MVKSLKELRFYPCLAFCHPGETDSGAAGCGNRAGLFWAEEEKTIAGYEDYVREGIEKGRRPELVGGG